MKISETTTIGFSSAGHTLCHLLTLLFPTVLLALEVELELSFNELATLAVPGAFLFGAGALPAGWLGDRWRKTTLLEIYFYGTGAMTILTGFAQTPLMLAVGLAGIGIFASIYHPVGMSWLVSRTSKTGTALGFNGLFGSIGFFGSSGCRNIDRVMELAGSVFRTRDCLFGCGVSLQHFVEDYPER